MKRTILVGFSVILLLTSTFGYAQQVPQKEPATKLEQFLAKKGKLIVRDSHGAGVLHGQYGTKITVYAFTLY